MLRGSQTEAKEGPEQAKPGKGKAQSKPKGGQTRQKDGPEQAKGKPNQAKGKPRAGQGRCKPKGRHRAGQRETTQNTLVEPPGSQSKRIEH